MHKGSQDLNNRKGIIAFQAELRKELKDGDGHAFGQKASIYKQTIQDIDSTLKNDRKHMKETLGALTDMLKAANTYIEADKCFADHLENMGTNSLKTGSQHPTIGNALIKVSLLFKDVSSLMKIKIKSINESLIGPLKTFIELGAQKDLRESFEKTWKNYDAVMNKKTKQSADTHLDGADPFEDISESKRKAKHDVCDFMIKFNEISSKTGADFVTQLITLYDEEVTYFDKGRSCLKNLDSYMVNLRSELANLQANQEQDKMELQAIRDKLKPPKPETLTTAIDQRQKEEFSLTQAGDASFGLNIHGNLNKRTEGIHRWQKRHCKVDNFHFSIAHNQNSPPTANLYLLTCQVKETPSTAVDGKRNCFHLISHDRTYHFEAPSEVAMRQWTTVIRNNIDQSIKSEVGDLTAHTKVDTNSDDYKLREFVKRIIHKIKTTPGNDRCVDCGRPDPTWFAVNLGVLVCIHCSGAHRKLGVHNSRIRSLDLDNPVTAELLLLYKIGNQMYNDVFKATARPSDNISHDTNSIEERHAHIRSKHEDKKYIKRLCANAEEMGQVLHKCVESKDIRGLLQVFGEGVKLGSPIPNSLYEETALHIAVTKEDETSLHIVDFLAQNCQGDDIDKQDTDGKTALHFAVINNKPQSIKILLRGNANPRIKDNAGESPLDLVKEDQEECRQLLELALNGKHLARCDVVNFNWEIEGQPDLTTCELDYTDDELEDTTPEKAERHKSKRSVEHGSRTPGYNTVSGMGSMVHNAHNSHNLASQAAQIAANKKTFDPTAGGLVYNSSPRSSFSHQPSRSSSNSRPSLPAQSPYRTGTNTGPGMNLPPNIPTNSPITTRSGRKGSTGVNQGPTVTRKSNKGSRTHGETSRSRADSSPASRLPRRSRNLTPDAHEKRSRLGSFQEQLFQKRSLSESQVGNVKPKPPSKIAIKRASIDLERKVDETREAEVTLPSPTPAIVVSPDPKPKKEKRRFKKKLGKSKSVEEGSANSVQILPPDDTSEVVLRSKSLANSKKAKVRRSSSYMFPTFRNRSKTSDLSKNEEGLRAPNRAVSSCKGIYVKDKSSSIDRLKSRLSGSRASSLKRKQSLRSSNCSIDSASSQVSLNSSFTSLYNKDSSNTDLRHPSVNVNPPYHDPLFDSTNMELADALGRPPPPPPRYCPGAPNSAKQKPKSFKPEVYDDIESEYADLGDIAAPKSGPKKPTTLRLKSRNEEVNSVYEEIDFISPAPEPNIPAATSFPPSASEELQQKPSGIQPPKASSPIKRRGAQVRRQSRQKSFDHSLTIESEYCSLGEIRRPDSLELERGVTEEDIIEEISRVNSLREKDADTPRPDVPSRDHGNSGPHDSSPRDDEDKLDSIYCELGDVFNVEDPTPTPEVEQQESEEKIDISRYRKDSQSSAYDLSESDSDTDKEEPIYAVVRKDRITSQSAQSTSNSLKFTEVDGGFVANYQGVDEETFEADVNSDGEMYYPTSDSTSSCGSPIKRGIVVEHLNVEGHSAVPGVVSRGAVSSSVTRNRSFTMDQGPGIVHSRHGSRQEHLEERLMRSCSVSVTTPKMQRNERDDGRSMTVSAVSGGGPPSVPHRAPPALPPRSQRRRVEAMYDCEADDIDELSFKTGDIIVVVEEIDDSWWFGMIDGDDSRKGIFPKNFIRPYEPAR